MKKEEMLKNKKHLLIIFLSIEKINKLFNKMKQFDISYLKTDKNCLKLCKIEVWVLPLLYMLLP